MEAQKRKDYFYTLDKQRAGLAKQQKAAVVDLSDAMQNAFVFSEPYLPAKPGERFGKKPLGYQASSRQVV